MLTNSLYPQSAHPCLRAEHIYAGCQHEGGRRCSASPTLPPTAVGWLLLLCSFVFPMLKAFNCGVNVVIVFTEGMGCDFNNCIESLTFSAIGLVP